MFLLMHLIWSYNYPQSATFVAEMTDKQNKSRFNLKFSDQVSLHVRG